MCTTEIWTFRECGCTLHHHVSCPPRRQVVRTDDNEYDLTTSEEGQDWLLLQPGTAAQGWTSMKSPRMDNEPVGLALSPASEMQCSVVHTVHKQFLDPVCDECVVEEQKRANRLSNIVILDETSPIWSSEVIIEIDPQDRPHTSYSRPSSKLGSIRSEDVSPSGPSSRKRASRRLSLLQLRDLFLTPSPTLGDADDEESERGRSRRSSPVAVRRDLSDVHNSRTKEFRRRGVDIARSDLRISSRWSSRERRSMEDFRDNIKEKAMGRGRPELEAVSQQSKQSSSWTTQSKDLKEKVVKGLRRGLSRSRSRHRSRQRSSSIRADAMTPPPMPRSPCTQSNKSSDSLQIRGRQMPRSRSRSENTLLTPRSSDDAHVQIVPEDVFKDEVTPQKPSWEEHLQRDITYQPKQERNRQGGSVSSRRNSGSMPNGFRWSYQFQNASTLDVTTVTQTRIGSPISKTGSPRQRSYSTRIRSSVRSREASPAPRPKTAEVRGSTEFDADHWCHNDIQWSSHYFNAHTDAVAGSDSPSTDFDENYLLNTIPKNRGPASLSSTTYRKRNATPRSLSTKRSGTLASVPESYEDVETHSAKSLSSTASIDDNNIAEKSVASSSRSNSNSHARFYSARTSVQNSLHSTMDDEAFFESYDYEERTPTLPNTMNMTTETFKLAAGANLVLSEMVASLRAMSDEDLPRKFY